MQSATPQLPAPAHPPPTSCPLCPHSLPSNLAPQVHDSQLEGAAGTAGGGTGGETSSSRSRARLAAAMGLPQMVLPFWSGATWDKQHGVDVERQR